MNTNLSHIHEVHETSDPDEVTRMLRYGDWQLLGVFQRATISDGCPSAWPLYALGRGDTSRNLHDIESVDELSRSDADEALQDGAVLLKVLTQKDGDGEFARFIIGKPREAA